MKKKLNNKKSRAARETVAASKPSEKHLGFSLFNLTLKISGYLSPRNCLASNFKNPATRDFA